MLQSGHGDSSAVKRRLHFYGIIRACKQYRAGVAGEENYEVRYEA